MLTLHQLPSNVENHSQKGTTYSLILTNEYSPLCPKDASWIVEDNRNGRAPDGSFADFDEFWMNGTVARSTDGTEYGVGGVEPLWMYNATNHELWCTARPWDENTFFFTDGSEARTG
jgi:hypothetical protein